MHTAPLAPQLHNTGTSTLTLGSNRPSIRTVHVINKPYPAFWTSTYLGRGKERGVFHSSWNDWALENGMHKRNDFLLVPKKDARVLDIASFKDYAELKKLPNPDNPEEEAINFAWYAEHGFDGVHVTEAAIAECRWNQMPDGFFRMGLSCWDAESTAWFHTGWAETVQKLAWKELRSRNRPEPCSR